MKSKQYIGWMLMGLTLFVSCSKSLDEPQKKGLTFGDEMELIWEKALPYLVVHYEPEYTDERDYDDTRSKYLYYDEYTQSYDFTRDVNGYFFSPVLMKDTAKEEGFYYEWKYPERYGDYRSIMEHFTSRNDIPVIEDLEYYFSDIPTYLLLPTEGGCLDGASDSIDRPYFFNKLHQLQLLQEGKTNIFPMEIIRYLRHYEQYTFCSMSHVGDVPEYLYNFLFEYRLLQQVARLCPDITMIATAISDDHMIAVDDVIYTMDDDYYYHADRAFVYLRQPDGRYAVDIVDICPRKAKVIKIFENANYIAYRITSDCMLNDASFCYDKKKQKWLREN